MNNNDTVTSCLSLFGIGGAAGGDGSFWVRRDCPFLSIVNDHYKAFEFNYFHCAVLFVCIGELDLTIVFHLLAHLCHYYIYLSLRFGLHLVLDFDPISKKLF